MSATAEFRVALVLSARDALLDAGISVVAYDFRPDGSGMLSVAAADRARAIQILMSRKIEFMVDP